MVFIKLVTLISLCILLMIGVLVLVGGISIIFDKISEKTSKDIQIVVPIIITLIAVAIYLSGAVLLLDWLNKLWWHF